MSDSENKSGILEGYRSTTMRIGNAIVTVHQPTNLSAEERRRREEQVKVSMLGMAEELYEKEKENVS